MKKTDKFLTGFVVFVVVLVVAAFIIALTRSKPTYRTDGTPEGVAFNYLFALQQGDFERAHGYLSPSIQHYPKDVTAFRNDIHEYSWQFDALSSGSVTLEVVSSETIGATTIVKIKETSFYAGGLFESGESSNTFEMDLRQDQTGAWKITDSDSYWVYCWTSKESCK